MKANVWKKPMIPVQRYDRVRKKQAKRVEPHSTYRYYYIQINILTFNALNSVHW